MELDEWVNLAQVIWYGARNGVVYVIFALGLSLLFGVMRVVNFAHGEFFMLGAMFFYVFATVLGLNIFLSLIFALALGGLVGFIANRVAVLPFLKTKRATNAVLLSTAALSYILYHGSVGVWGSWVVPIKPFFAGKLQLGGVMIEVPGIVLIIIGTMLVLGLYFLFTRVKLGKEMRATAQNKMAASLLGVNVSKIYDVTMITSAVLAAVGGILLAQVTFAFTGMGRSLLVLGFAIVIIGGMDDIKGVVATGLIIGLTEALFGYYVSPAYKLAFVYGLMIVVLLWKPHGVFQRRLG